VPFGALPVAVHWGVPEEHAITIVWQLPASEQSAPAAQATHIPLEHTADASGPS
jgi:hypothetical protein